MRRYLLLLFSLALLSCSPVKKYIGTQEVQDYESDIRKFEQLDKSEQYSENAILFAGSSSIRLWSTLENDMAPYPVIQRGFGGAKLSDLAVYAGRIIDPHKCRAIVIFIANDISGSEQDKSPKEVAALFRSVLKTIRKTHPTTPVFWIAITPTESRWRVWPKIQEANKQINKICDNQNNTYFIRTDYAFLDNTGKPIPELFRDDKLHLSESGYAVWTGIIKKELDRVLENR
jgi:lysophospholipase L1-like esterase